MHKHPLVSKWIYGLLLIPFVSGIFALQTHQFVFKAGVAGSGILILMLLHLNRKHSAKDWWLIAGAFLFSIGGDWCLSNRHGETGMFVAGIALFFFAHVSYLWYGLSNGRLHRSFTLILLAGYLAFFFLKLYPSINEQLLMWAALIYLLISCFSLGAAAGIKANTVVKWAYILGISLILFSDTIIAFKEFAGWKTLNFLILPTYYLAQISITLSLMLKKNLNTV